MKIRFEFIGLMVLLLIATTVHFAFANCTGTGTINGLPLPQPCSSINAVEPGTNNTCPPGYQISFTGSSTSSTSGSVSCTCCFPSSTPPPTAGIVSPPPAVNVAVPPPAVAAGCSQYTSGIDCVAGGCKWCGSVNGNPVCVRSTDTCP